ncbi:MAG: NYN domain-containing protein [Syntrophobacteraceae bacterium]
MTNEPKPEAILSSFPVQVFKRLIEDISIEAWGEILKENPGVRKEVLGGFSFRPKKLDRILSQPVTMVRLQRRLRADIAFLDRVLDAWSDESPALAYLSMLDIDFVASRWRQIRDLLGPERFCLALFLLDAFRHGDFVKILGEKDFWSPAPDKRMYELLVLPLTVWSRFVEENPEAAEKLHEEVGHDPSPDFGFGTHHLEEEEDGPRREPEPESSEPFKKVEKKLQKAQDELTRATEQLAHAKAENEDLRKKLKECEIDFDRKLRESAAQQRAEWFARYRGLETETASGEAARLESLLQRTRRALELQGRADEEYGLISDIRARLLEVDQSLARIESVYANSLVVHKEVEKVKEALLDEKKRLLRLPGIARLTGGARKGGDADILGRINLMDPVPANLPKLNRLRSTLELLADAGLVSDAAALEEALAHKTRQIQERIYHRFEPGAEAQGRQKSFRDFDDFVGSGESRRYELYVDGYNVLLSVHESEEAVRQKFTELREHFVEMVLKRSPRFARVFLVFDGVENSRDVRGNTEIIYTDKRRKVADAVIIEKVLAKKDKKILLVTADEEIIAATRDRIFALIDPADFYMFVFE